MFIENIDLSGFVDIPALLLLATQGVDNGKNVITFNAPPGVAGQSYEDARDEDYFVGRILENPSTTCCFPTAPTAYREMKLWLAA